MFTMLHGFDDVLLVEISIGHRGRLVRSIGLRREVVAEVQHPSWRLGRVPWYLGDPAAESVLAEPVT